MKKNKEEAIKLYIDMIKKSWTYDKLTDDEKARLNYVFKWSEEQGLIKGSFKDRWDTLQVLYTSYITALGYSPLGWRE